MTYQFEDVFAYKNLYKASQRCMKNVGWKPSVQRYRSNEIVHLADLYDKLHSNRYKFRGFYEFNLWERGKLRHIKSLHITDRVIQKCFCDNCLTDVLTKRLIYDNGACLKNKGIHFARKRLACHLRQFYNKFGNDGYILLFDFKSFFDSIPHKQLKLEVNKLLVNKRLCRLYNNLVDDFGGNKGLGLGSQISQVSATFYLNKLDKFMKEQMKAKFYGRYMDDGYIISNSKKYLNFCLDVIIEICDILQVKLNLKKTHIFKLSTGFSFLKRKYLLTNTGKIVIRLARKNIIYERRKLRKLFKLLINKLKPKLTLEHIRICFTSWQSQLKTLCCYKTNFRMTKFFEKFKTLYLKSV